MSLSFIDSRLRAAIRLFRWIYGDGGFRSDCYLKEERTSYLTLSETWRARVTDGDLRSALSSPSPEAYATELLRLLTDSGRRPLLPRRYADALKKRLAMRDGAVAFLRATRDLLFSSSSDARGTPSVDAFNRALAPYYSVALAKGDIKPASHCLPSLMLWLLDPDEQFFVRPDLHTRAARVLSGGFPEGRARMLTDASYAAAVAFARELKEAVSALEPQDMIDVWCFARAICGRKTIWFGNTTSVSGIGEEEDRLSEFRRRQVYAIGFGDRRRPDLAERLRQIAAGRGAAGLLSHRAELEALCETDTERMALLRSLDLAASPDSLLLATSGIRLDRRTMLPQMTIMAVGRTGSEIRIDDTLGLQLSVTWLGTPGHVAVVGDYASKLGGGPLAALPVDEALDAIAFGPAPAPEAIPEEPGDAAAAPSPPATPASVDPRGRGTSGSKPPPLQPDYSVQAFSREAHLPVGTVESWLRRLRRKKHVIIQGPPGTGKTFVAERLARALVSNTRGFWDTVQFHPSYAYEDFVQGLRPRAGAASGAFTYELEPGRFLRFCEEAERRTDGAPCVLVIDEINRANLARVFGELMYLLEYRDRRIPLAGGGTDERRFGIPSNVYILGTMNTADRSIALVDHALRRRFSFISLGPAYDALRGYLEAHRLPGADSLVRVLQTINAAIGDKHYELGISFFLQDGAELPAVLEEIWKGEIEPYLEEYFYDQPEKVEPFRWEALIAGELSDWRCAPGMAARRSRA